MEYSLYRQANANGSLAQSVEYIETAKGEEMERADFEIVVGSGVSLTEDLTAFDTTCGDIVVAPVKWLDNMTKTVHCMRCQVDEVGVCWFACI